MTVNSILFGNSSYYGGAIYNHTSDLTLTHCDLIANNSTYLGGAISHYHSTSYFNNCIIRNNESPGEIISAGISYVSHSLIQGGFQGINNRQTDPMFTSLTGDYASSDLTLLPCSPAIDAADDTVGIPTDFLGMTRNDDPGVPNCDDPDAGLACGLPPVGLIRHPLPAIEGLAHHEVVGSAAVFIPAPFLLRPARPGEVIARE